MRQATVSVVRIRKLRLRFGRLDLSASVVMVVACVVGQPSVVVVLLCTVAVFAKRLMKNDVGERQQVEPDDPQNTRGERPCSRLSSKRDSHAARLRNDVGARQPIRQSATDRRHGRRLRRPPQSGAPAVRGTCGLHGQHGANDRRSTRRAHRAAGSRGQRRRGCPWLSRHEPFGPTRVSSDAVPPRPGARSQCGPTGRHADRGGLRGCPAGPDRSRCSQSNRSDGSPTVEVRHDNVGPGHEAFVGVATIAIHRRSRGGAAGPLDRRGCRSRHVWG